MAIWKNEFEIENRKSKIENRKLNLCLWIRQSESAVARPRFCCRGEENSSLVGGLSYLLIVEKTDGLYRCEAKFGNWGPKG